MKTSKDFLKYRKNDKEKIFAIIFMKIKIFLNKISEQKANNVK